MKNMKYNFDILYDRVLDSLNKTDLEEIKEILSKIKKPTIVSGVGGSRVVSNFTSKVIGKKNGIITIDVEPRDLLHMPISNFDNIIACSYSGKNFGVESSFDNNLNHYLFSNNRREDVTNITYSTSLDPEHSFISIAATLIPMSIMLYYYSSDISIIEEILSKKLDKEISIKKVYEIITGYESSTSSRYLESTLIEAGLGVPIIHDKYSLCHGRTTYGYHNDTEVIMLNNDINSDLDRVISENMNPIVLERNYSDDIINDYYLTYMSMLLTQKIAEENGKDLSKVLYSPLVKKFYKFRGKM